MGGILDILKYLWAGRQAPPMGQNNPMLTPGYNGQPNPADEVMRRQQAPTPVQSGSLPPIQQQPSGGLKGLLQNPQLLQENPQLLQGIAQIALSQGDYGGSRAAGFNNQTNAQNQLELQQNEAAERSRQFNEQIGLRRQEMETEQKQRNTTSMAQLIPVADTLGVKIQEAGDFLGVQVDPAIAAKLDAARAKRAQSKLTYIDVNPDSELYGEIIPVPDPDNPYHYGMDTKIATQLAKSLKKPKVVDEYYINRSGGIVSKQAYDSLPAEARTALEGPLPAAQAVTRAGQLNVKPEVGKDIPVPPAVEAQQIRIARAKSRAESGRDTAEDVADFAQAVATGQMEITAVPIKLRAAVVGAVKDSGQLIVSAKEREGIQALDIPLGIISDIERYADKINTESGISARAGGALRSIKATAGYDPDVTALRSKVGTLALLIRALGEKGTLAEGDVARAIALIPSVTDTKQEKDNKIRDLRQILQSAKEVKTKGASQTFGQGVNNQVNTTGNSEADAFLKKKGL
jgi:hypothetical protein